jgi:hypothetical protein
MCASLHPPTAHTLQMADDVVAHEGSLGREMFFLVNGNVDVTAMVWEGMDLLPGSTKFKRIESLVSQRYLRSPLCAVWVVRSGWGWGRV